MTLVHNLLLNSEVLIWRKSGNWTRFYRLLAVKDKTCCIQFPSGLTSFRNTSIKPYFWPKTTYNVKPDELKATAKPDEPEVTAKPDELEAPLFTIKVPKEFTKPVESTIKCG